MAILPGTKFAEGTPSGQTGQTLWNAPPPGEGQQIAAGIEKMGATVFAYALKVEKQKMLVDLSEKKRMIDERGWSAREAMSGDEEADKTVRDTFKTEAIAIAGSSKWVDNNTDLGMYLNDVLPNWEHGLRMESLNKQRAIAKDTWNLNYKKTLENGGSVETMIAEAEKVGLITRVQAENYRKTAPGDALLAQAERLVAQGNYNLAIAELDKTEKMDLTTEQLKEKQALKLAAEKAKADTSDALTEDVLKKAQTMDIQTFRTELQRTVGISEQEKAKLLTVFIGGQKLWQDNGENPFTETRDWPLYLQLKAQIAEKQVTKPSQIFEQMLSDPKNGPRLGYVQLNDLLSDLPDRQATTGFSLNDPVVKGFLGEYRKLFAKPTESIPADKLKEYAVGYGELKDAMKAKYPDYKAMADEYERVTGKAKERSVKGIWSEMSSFKPYESFKLGMRVGFNLPMSLTLAQYASKWFSGKYTLSKESEAPVSQKSPFPEYPDAYLEDGMWTVEKDGKKYRVQP